MLPFAALQGKRFPASGPAPQANGRAAGSCAAIAEVHTSEDQSGSPMMLVEPCLKSPVATVGGAVPEQTGLPYLSRRAER